MGSGCPGLQCLTGLVQPLAMAQPVNITALMSREGHGRSAPQQYAPKRAFKSQNGYVEITDKVAIDGKISEAYVRPTPGEHRRPKMPRAKISARCNATTMLVIVVQSGLDCKLYDSDL